jgi:PAS domain S-box-containing protein
MSAAVASRLPVTAPAARAQARSPVHAAQLVLTAVPGVLGVLGVATFALHRNLLSLFPGTTPFAFNVGAGLCLLSVAIGFRGRRWAGVAAAGAAALGGLTLVEHAFGVSLGIDRLLFEPYHHASSAGTPGRMAPNTALCLFLAGCATVLRGRLGTAVAVVPFAVALVAGLGYTDPRAEALSRLGQSVTMAFPTALGLASASAAVVVQRQRAYFERETVGGTLVRRMVPAAIVVPVLGAGLVLGGARSGLFGQAVGLWAVTALSVGTALGAIVWIARVLDRQEMVTHAGLSLQAETARNLTEGLCVRRESDGEVLSKNPALDRIFGYRTGELVGTRRLLLSEQDERLMRKALAAEGEWMAEARTIRADGTPFWCSIKASTFKHPDHGLLRVALYHDVTARREAEDRRREAEAQRAQALEELERSNAELEQFAHVASHDLSEPLRVVSGFVSLLQRRYEGRLDEDADRFIEAAVSGVDRMQALIDALLAYSRVGSGDLSAADVAAGEAAQSALDVLAARIEETGAQVHLGALPTVHGDAVLLERVFQNLVANALKFRGAERPEVQIGAEPGEDGTWVFHVRDNGEGIPPEHAERVFGMFQRLHGRETPGTGIGLSITRRIVERHGGRIWIEPSDQGTEVRFTLPSASA